LLFYVYFNKISFCSSEYLSNGDITNPYNANYLPPLPLQNNRYVYNPDNTIKYKKPRPSCCSYQVKGGDVNLMPFSKPSGYTNLFSDYS
jgi:hypothetical protein